MRRFRSTRGTVIAAAAVLVVSVSVNAGYRADARTQLRRPNERGIRSTSGNRRQAGGVQADARYIEADVARALRAEGLAQQGQILVLGAPGRIVLLGSVSSLEDKRQAGRITRQVAGVRRVQNRIRISRDRSRANDTQLQWQLRERLRRLDPELADNVHVQAQTGKVILSGPVRDWRDLADVIEAAFAVGAESVVSRLEAGPAGQHLHDMGEPTRTRRERSHRSPSPRADTFQYGTTRREGTDAGQYARPQRQPRDGRYGTRGTRGPRRSTQPRRAPGRRPTVLEGSQWYDLESNAQYEFTREPGRPTEEPQRRPRPRRTPQRFGNGAPPSRPERMMARERPSAQGYYPPYGYERDDSDRRPSDRPTRPRQDRQGRYLADRQSPGRSTRRQRTALSQSALAGRVRNRLIETLSGAENVRVLPPGDVCVVVEGGDVTLVGSVGDSDEKRRAERAVRSLQGVDRVRNYLTIGGREDRTTSQRLATRGDSEQRARRVSPSFPGRRGRRAAPQGSSASQADHGNGRPRDGNPARGRPDAAAEANRRGNRSRDLRRAEGPESTQHRHRDR